jgi:hypothetical protein
MGPDICLMSRPKRHAEVLKEIGRGSIRGFVLAVLVVMCAFQAAAKDKDIKIHGYVTSVHTPASFEVDDYRVMTDQSVTLEFDTDEDEENQTDYPKDIHVGSEIEIRGSYNEESRELKAKSVKVYTRESKKLKRTALLNTIPNLQKQGASWEGTFRVDGQTVVVNESTAVVIAPNATQRKALKAEEKKRKQAKKTNGAVAEGEFVDSGEQSLVRLADVHTNMYVAYEGLRLDNGSIRATRITFKDNELTGGEAKLWKSLTPKVTAYKGTKPGELKLGKAGKFKLAPNDEVQSYLRGLGERLVPESQKKLSPGDPNRIPFQFYVGEEKYPNAFATANGVVVVLTPMLALADNEAQLAAVLGHEIAHSVQEHTLRQIEFHKKKRMLLTIGAAVAAGYGAYNVSDLLNLTSAAITNGYQRYLENQADRVGMEYMVNAGYDPREAPKFWKTMSLKTGGDSATNFFWSSHDNNTTRRSYLMSELAVNYRGIDFENLRRDGPEFTHIRGLLREMYSKHKKIKVKF